MMLAMTLAFAQQYIGTNLPAANFADWPADFFTNTQYIESKFQKKNTEKVN